MVDGHLPSLLRTNALLPDTCPGADVFPSACIGAARLPGYLYYVTSHSSARQLVVREAAADAVADDSSLLGSASHSIGQRAIGRVQ